MTATAPRTEEAAAYMIEFSAWDCRLTRIFAQSNLRRG